MADSLINFSDAEFKSFMTDRGLPKTTEGVVLEADRLLKQQGFSQGVNLDVLRDGTWSGFEGIKRYQGIDPSDRQLGDEEILSIFTNVRDFGMFGTKEESSGADTRAKLYGAGRSAPEAIGSLGGAALGMKAVAPFANMIPPLGLPGLAARGIVYLGGAVGGSILLSTAAGEAEDAIIGEQDPVIPSLQPDVNFGDTAAFAATFLTSPWTLAPKTTKMGTGALEFLANFKNVASGKFAQKADNAFELTAKGSGLSANAFKKANDAREKASSGKMFGGALGVDLGLTRFNPAGYLFDPRKGPVTARVIGGIEGGIGRSLEKARLRPIPFLTIEGAAGVGASYGSSFAQELDPYGTTSRLIGEVAGSLVVPAAAELAIKTAPDVYQTVKNWWGKADEGLLSAKFEKDSVKRIMMAIEKSDEYITELNAAGQEVKPQEKLTKFIEQLNKVSVDADNNPVSFTAADLAEINEMPFSRTIRTIQNELEKSSSDLQFATGRGREELQAGALNAIRTLAATGDPQALVIAARIQQGLFEQNIVDGIENGVNTLYDNAATVLGRDAVENPALISQRVNLSEKLYDVLDNQIQLSKKRETELWKSVGNYQLTEFYAKNGRQIKQPNILQLLDTPSVRNGLKFASKGSQKRFESSLKGTMDDIEELKEYFQEGTGKNPATAQRFFEMRSDVLDEASKLRTQGQVKAAERLSRVADALLRDLTGQKNDASAAYNAARSYTFARNNVFTRSFINDLQTVDKFRSKIMDPKELLDAYFKGGPNSTVQRYDQIQAAGRFLIDEAGFSEEQVNAMGATGIMQNAIRDSLDQFIEKKSVKDPLTGKNIERFIVNEQKYNTFMKKPESQELMTLLGEQFAEDFSSLEAAQNTFDGFLVDVTDRLKPSQARRMGFSEEQISEMYKQKAINMALEYEDTGRLVSESLKSDRPTIALNELYNIVQDTNFTKSEFTKDQAMQGLKQAIINHALTKSGMGGTPNAKVLQETLFGQLEGVPPNIKFNLADFMVRKDLMTVDEVDELEAAIKTMKGVEEAFQTGDFENVLFKQPSLAKLFYLRIFGATAGSAIQNKMKSVLGLPQMGGGLIAEQTGSELVQRLLLKGPESQRIKIMTKLFSNPNSLAKAMQTINNKNDLDNVISNLEKGFGIVASQTGRRVPYGIRALGEEDVTLPSDQEALDEIQRQEDEERKARARGRNKARTGPPEIPVSPSVPIDPRINIPPTVTPTNRQAVDPRRAAAPAPIVPNNVSQPATQSRYAALFPNDPISSMIRNREGIGSLI